MTFGLLMAESSYPLLAQVWALAGRDKLFLHATFCWRRETHN